MSTGLKPLEAAGPKPPEATGECKPEPRKQGEVADKVDQLFKTATNLETSIDSLANRLVPVLGPWEKNEPPKPGPTGACALGGALEAIIQRLEQCRAIVQAMENALEL